jgi:carbohydrate kinase (thermoresistant glucokinase family)
MSAPPILVVMGVAGAGKTTVGELVARKLAWSFIDGDQLHSKANVAKMRSGVPLTDADRAPWLAAIGGWIDARAAADEPGVVTCSALKRAYRDSLRAGRPQVRIAYLRGSQAQIAQRLAIRSGHFWPPELLASQFVDLEEPGPDEHAIVVDFGETPEGASDRIIEKLPHCS